MKGHDAAGNYYDGPSIQIRDWPPGMRFTDHPREAARPFLPVRYPPPDTIAYSIAGGTALAAAEHRHAGL